MNSLMKNFYGKMCLYKKNPKNTKTQPNFLKSFYATFLTMLHILSSELRAISVSWLHQVMLCFYFLS